MKNFRKTLKRTVKINYRQMLKTATEISIETGRARILVFFDMIYCAVKFGADCNDYKKTELYRADKEAKSTYLTTETNRLIIEKYNDREMIDMFDRRSEFYRIYFKFIGRRWVDLNDIDNSRFSLFIKKYNPAIVKSSDRKLDIDTQIMNFDSIENLYGKYNDMISSNQTVIEEMLTQHPEMEKFNPQVFNSVKVYTFVKKKQAYILQVMLKTEADGNEILAFANTDGKICTYGIDSDGRIYEKHPATDKFFEGFQIPMYNHLRDFVKSAALLVQDAAYVCWDIAITPTGFALINGNARPEVIQPTAGFNKGGNGILPIYRRYMDI